MKKTTLKIQRLLHDTQMNKDNEEKEEGEEEEKGEEGENYT